jgi:Flp pilus assembly protein TadG
MNRVTQMIRNWLARFVRSERGGAAAEVAIWCTVIMIPLLSAADVAFYTYRRMQVDQAVQAGSAAVWTSCNTSAKLPAVKNCSGLATTIASAIHSTSLGSAVSTTSGFPTEGYYCVNGAGALQLLGVAQTIGGNLTPPSPFDCSSVVAGSPTKPGDYIRLQVTYSFTPTFSAVPVTAFLPTTIVSEAWVRLN